MRREQGGREVVVTGRLKHPATGLDILGRRESISLEIKRDPLFFFNPPANLVKFLLINWFQCPPSSWWLPNPLLSNPSLPAGPLLQSQ